MHIALIVRNKLTIKVVDFYILFYFMAMDNDVYEKEMSWMWWC
jgi:hypothetical protein